MFSLAWWKRSAAVAPAPESVVVAATHAQRGGDGKKDVMASNGVENPAHDGPEDMETDMSPEPNGEWFMLRMRMCVRM